MTVDSRNGSWPIAYRWAAMGTLVAYTALGSKVVAPAFAQTKPRPRPATESHSKSTPALPVRRFEIPGGPLDTVLNAFQNQSELQVAVAKDAIKTLSSPGVTGLLTPSQALERLLAGTSVEFRFIDDRTVSLDLANEKSSVEVREAIPQVSSFKYTEPILDTPQTISVIPRNVIEEQGATTLRDVLRNVPGLTVAAGEGGTAAGDNITLRGFSARNDMFVDGSRDLSTQSRDPFNMEQVEVTKGPTSAFSGRGSAGGTVNMVSKTASLRQAFGGSATFGNDGTKRVTSDINLPLSRLGLGERTAFRLNSMYHHSDLNGRDVVEYNRWGLAPTLTFGVGTPTRLTLSYFKTKQDNISDYGIPWVPATNNALAAYRDRPAPVPRNTFYGLKDRDYELLNQDMGTIRFEHEFSDSMSIRNQFRYARSTRNSNATPPRFASNASTAINRELRAWLAEDKIADNQTDFTARFNTGKLQHALVAGSNFTWENNVRNTRSGPNMATTLLNPNPNDVYTGVITNGAYTGDITGKTQAVYAFDTIRITRFLEATGGARWERFAVDGVNTSNAPLVRTDKMTSTRAGLVFKPTARGSVYASYGTSLSPSLEGLSYNTSNTYIPPEKTYTTEIGTKWNVAAERLMLSAAVFDVKKDNARTPGTDPLIPQVLDGKQRVRGIEMGATGSVTSSLRVAAGYTFMEPRIIKSNTPAEVGRYFQNTPQNSASIWATYTRKKFMAGAGPRWVGKRYGNNTNTRMVPSYWTMDAMASYNVNRHLDLRLNVFNLNDEYYFDRLGGGHLIPGMARTVQGGFALKF